MFGSSAPFGQSASSPFGNQSVFGQTNNASANPFAPKPFGSTSPFGSQSGSSVFGGTSTGVFGSSQPSAPAFGASTTPAFGASTTPAFGSAMPSFGASSAPSFGGASSSFSGSSIFGQKPAFGGFGSSPSQTSPFGGAFQQSQPAFGSNLFGSSSPFGASSQPAFGASSTSGFGTTSTPAFGSATTPAFGAPSTPTFGSTPTQAFGSTGAGFGVSGAPAFGSSSASAFGASSTPLFGSSSTPSFASSSAPTFGSSTPAFGTSSTPSFSFGSTPAFGQTTTAAFGSNPFGSTSSPFGSSSSAFGAQTATSTFGSPGFGQSTFGVQRGGSRVAAYTPTADVDGATGTQPPGKLESISAMPVYQDKSHEELRWDDYQRGDKGGPNPAAQPASGFNQSNPFGTSTFGTTAANPFSSSTPSNPFAPKTATFGSSGFGASTTPAFSSAFAASSSNPFGISNSASAPSIFGQSSISAFGNSSSPSLLAPPSSPFSSSSSIFGSSATGASSTFGTGLAFGNTQSSGLFQSSTSSLVQTAAFGPGTSSFGQPTSAFGSTNLFGTSSSGFGGNLFSSTPSLLSNSNPGVFGQSTSSLSTFQAATTAQPSAAFPFGNYATQPGSSGFGGVPNVLNQGTFGQFQSSNAMQPAPVSNPFGTLPAMPQMSIGRNSSAPSVQYGISSMPVVDKPAPVRVSYLLNSRHLSQRRLRLHPRKYHPKSDGPKVPFFCDDEALESTPKADALFVPRENPRALVIRPVDQWPSRASSERLLMKDMSSPVNGSAKISEGSAPALNGPASNDHENNISGDFDKHPNASPASTAPKQNGVHNDHVQKSKSYITISGHRAGEAAIVYEHGADIEALMPKLRHSDYYTDPKIQELAAKERAEPGYCRRVKDFVVGRHGYGSIKFLEETDVRRLDLESIVQFNTREVIVYTDESKKPPVGQGLNKPAEVTLLNIKCLNKKTGEQYTEGPLVDKYREMLRKKTQDQGAEFVSYNPVKGEWKFRVNHFSGYGLSLDSSHSPNCKGR